MHPLRLLCCMHECTAQPELCTNRPPKWDRSEEFEFLAKKSDLCILPNNLNFGLSEIVQGTFLKNPIIRQNNEFSKFRPDFRLLISNSLYFELILWVSDCMLGAWTCIMGVWTYKCGVWTYMACFGCLNLYLGVWTYTLGVWTCIDCCLLYTSPSPRD